MLFRKEYYKSPYYFFLKESKNDLTLYYSVSETLTEARKKDESIKFDKKSKPQIEKELTKIFQDKKLKDTESVTKKLKKVCKHLKIRLTVMRNGKRCPKSEKVLLKQVKKPT
jgi:hypothetical protein